MLFDLNLGYKLLTLIASWLLTLGIKVKRVAYVLIELRETWPERFSGAVDAGETYLFVDFKESRYEFLWKSFVR